MSKGDIRDGKKDSDYKHICKNILGSMDNGTISFIKQDRKVIQINVTEYAHENDIQQKPDKK